MKLSGALLRPKPASLLLFLERWHKLMVLLDVVSV